MIDYRAIIHLSGILLGLFALTLVPPFLLSLWEAGDHFLQFLTGFGGIVGTALILVILGKKPEKHMTARTGFMLTVVFWLILSLAAMLPMYLLLGSNGLSVIDALFESISGITTTGATVLSNLDDLPKSVLLYRQTLQWIGGLGIVVLAVAIVPLLNTGGTNLYRAEMAGPMKEASIAPRIATTAKYLWMVYSVLTLICATSYWAAGMSFFDAISHAFSTIAIGGFSTHDASLGHFDNPLIETVAIVFMLIASINFALHYVAIFRLQTKHYTRDYELNFFLRYVFLLAAVVSGVLYFQADLGGLTSIRHGLFTTVSFVTTTGFSSTDHTLFPSVVPFLLILGACFGGCAGSTSGGLKAVRVQVITHKAMMQFKKLLHPSGVFQIKTGRQSADPEIVDAIVSFFILYVFIYIVILVALLLCELDFYTAFSAAGATLNNLGPGLGDVSSTYATLPALAKLVLCVAMLLGRLEILTLLILLTPYFWRR